MVRLPSYLLLEDEHVAVLGLTAEPQTLVPGGDVPLVKVLGAHGARVLRPDDLVLVDVEAVQADGQVLAQDGTQEAEDTEGQADRTHRSTPFSRRPFHGVGGWFSRSSATFPRSG